MYTHKLKSVTKPWCNRSCCRVQLFSLTSALLPSDPSPLPKVRDYWHRLFLQSLHSVHLPGKANIMLKNTGCKCSQSSHTVDSFPQEEVTPLGKLLPYIKMQSFMQNSAHSACAPSQLAANKPKSEDIKKSSTESTFPLDGNLFMSPEKSRSKPNLYTTAQICQLFKSTADSVQR